MENKIASEINKLFVGCPLNEIRNLSSILRLLKAKGSEALNDKLLSDFYTSIERIEESTKADTRAFNMLSEYCKYLLETSK